MFLVRSVCLFVCLSVGLLANLWTDFDEIFWTGRAWLRDQVIQFWWRSGSRFGSGSPKSEIRILRIGGGLCSLSASSFHYSHYIFWYFVSFHFLGLYCFYLRTSDAFINKIIDIVIVTLARQRSMKFSHSIIAEFCSVLLFVFVDSSSLLGTGLSVPCLAYSIYLFLFFRNRNDTIWQ